MTHNRRELLAELKTSLESTTGVVTVVRCYEDLDILNYAEASLPLIEIKEPAESVAQQMVGRQQIIRMGLSLRVWFVSWAEIPTSTYETLMKNVRDKIAGNFTLSQKATGVWVTDIGPIQGMLPVYWFQVGLMAKYCLEEINT